MNNFSSLDCNTLDVQIRYLNAVNIDRLQPKGLISITAKLLIFAITIKIGFNTFMRFSVIIYLVQVISEWADTVVHARLSTKVLHVHTDSYPQCVIFGLRNK